MKIIKPVIIVLIIVALIALIVWLYIGNQTPSSFVFIYPPRVEASQINHDLKLLKADGFKFIGLKELKKGVFLKKKQFSDKTLAIFINKAPTAELIDILKKLKVSATFIINVEELPLAQKYKNLDFALTPTFQQAKPLNPNSGYINLNFDDGYESVYQNGLPVLKRAGFTASLFDIAQSAATDQPKYLSPNQLIDLQSEGWEIGSHSYGHEHFPQLTIKKALYSLTTSEGYLDGLGLYVKGFAFPYGEFNSEDLLISKQLYGYLRFTNNTFNLPQNKYVDGFYWKKGHDLSWFEDRIGKAKKEKLGANFILHEVSDNGRPYSIPIKLFKEVVTTIKKSGLPVYSNITLLGKPPYLRQEFGHSLESEKQYVDRLSSIIGEQKKAFKIAGLNPAALYYPHGVITNGLISAAKNENFDLAFGNHIGFLYGNLEPLDLKTITLRRGTVERIISAY